MVQYLFLKDIQAILINRDTMTITKTELKKIIKEELGKEPGNESWEAGVSDIINEKADDELFKQDFHHVSSPEGKVNIMIEFQGLTFNKFGIYKAIITEEGKSILETQLNVIKVNTLPQARA